MRAILILAALLAVTVAADAEARTVWLCKPGAAGNPCAGDLTTTVTSASGATAVERAKVARRAPIDCFYVYPTVSDQPTVNASLRVDPQERAVAEQQASRFSQVCRMWAPMYRQLTLKAIQDPAAITLAVRAKAYGDVRAAWRDYLARHNRGRGVVLVGHSQGTGMLTQLVKDEIDSRRDVRRRLVSALLIGGNVAERDFRHVPPCRSAGQTGCVVAYSAFGEAPPPDTRFGRPTRGSNVLCTNPASLGGGTARLRPYFPTRPFPGLIGAVSDPPPAAPTPWASFPGLYAAHCQRAGDVTWLQVDDVGGAGDPRPRVHPTLGPAWGLHLVDVNLALGDLVELARRQSASYVR